MGGRPALLVVVVACGEWWWFRDPTLTPAMGAFGGGKAESYLLQPQTPAFRRVHTAATVPKA